MSGSWVLLIIATTFAVVTGANEGAAIATMGVDQRVLRPLGAVVALTTGVVVAPALVGTAVARTLSQRLVSPTTVESRTAFAVGLCATLLVVCALTLARVPTSLSLALIGGVTGAGLGYGLPVHWPGVGEVLVFGLAAPLCGGLAGAAVAGALRCSSRSRRLPRAMRWATLAGYLGQVVAYGANGGQKVIAVFSVCGIAGTFGRHAGMGVTVIMGACFAAGTVLSLRRFAGRVGRDLVVVRPVHQLSAEVASSAAVLTSVAAGMPVSMTQVMASAFVGAGASEGRRWVRWRAALRLGTAWLVTLPASVGVALGMVASVRSIR